MSDEDSSELPTDENGEEISIADKAMIIGLEEVIEELKQVNTNLDFNNQNITNFREEIDALCVDNYDRHNELMNHIYDDREIKENTILKHLGMIRLMLFWGLFGIPILAGIFLFLLMN